MTGEKGEKGEKGEQGYPGLPGAQGAPGEGGAGDATALARLEERISALETTNINLTTRVQTLEATTRLNERAHVARLNNGARSRTRASSSPPPTFKIRRGPRT